MMIICIKQHLSNIWSSVHEKAKQHWGRVEKSVAYKKKRVISHYRRFSYFQPFTHDIITQNTTQAILCTLYTSFLKGEGVDEESNRKT